MSKHTYSAAALIVMIVFAIGSIDTSDSGRGGGSDAVPQNAAQEDHATSNANDNPETTEGDSTSSEEGSDGSRRSEGSRGKPKVYAIGDDVQIGYTSYAVWKAWWSDQLSSNQFLNKPPDASYLFIEISVRNNDNKARTIPPFKLLDEHGAEYEASSNGWAVEGSIGVLDSLNPGVNKQGFVVFDVPRNHSYRLKVSGGYWSTEDAVIEIVDEEELKRRVSDRQAELRRQAEQARQEEKAAQQQLMEEAKWRTWTSADGKFSAEAKFVKIAGDRDKVTLEKRDGKLVELSIKKLSTDDQEFIMERKWRNAPGAQE